jgi:hypothetical protein
MRTTIVSLFALLFSTFNGLCEHPSVRGGMTLTAEDIFNNMYDLEGEVIRIKFPSDNPKQISKELFSLNYGSGNQIAVVLLPSDVARKYFRPGSRPNLPPALFVEVTIGEIVNEYGAKEQGPILLGVGIKIHLGMGGTLEFKW